MFGLNWRRLSLEFRHLAQHSHELLSIKLYIPSGFAWLAITAENQPVLPGRILIAAPSTGQGIARKGIAQSGLYILG